MADTYGESREQRRLARRRALRRRRLIASSITVGALVVIVVLVALVLPSGGRSKSGSSSLAGASSGTPNGRISSTTSSPTSSASLPVTTTTVAQPAQFLGSDGVESSAIVAENHKPGTTAWRITGQPSTGMIEGFADHSYVADGQSFGLYVSTTAATYQVVAYRMGYYQGTGGRQIWASGQEPGQQQPACPVDHATNMVSCDNWAKSMTVAVTSAWVPGDYVLKLTASDGRQAYVLLTVWDPNSHATYLVVNRTMTEEGWNTFGGYDFYQGLGPCILDSDGYPPCNRARVVSLDRPFAEDNGAEDFFGNEYPLVFWMEEQGLDVTYVSDITLTEDPTFALQHKAWLSLDHDETWTYPEVQAVKQAMASGVNVLYFSGAAIVRHARLQASPLGTDREEVDYRNGTEDPITDPLQKTSNVWDPADAALTGELYSGYLLPGKPQVPMVIHDASSWVFKGTGVQDGTQIPGVIGSDIDHVNSDTGLVPADLQVLAHSPVPLSDALTNQGKWGSDTYSDFTYYADATSGAGVIDTGDTTFIGDLGCPPGAEGCQPACTSTCQATLLRIVGNMLVGFGQGPAGRLDPPAPNWRAVTPAGS